MNHLFYKSILPFASLILMSCSSHKNSVVHSMEKHPPFEVTKAVYLTEASETTIKITINRSDIQLDTVFFRNNKIPLARTTNSSGSIFTGTFQKKKTIRDYNLDKNPQKEFGNTPPEIKEKIPFELKQDEAVVSYMYQGKIKYYMLSGLKEKSR